MAILGIAVSLAFLILCSSCWPVEPIGEASRNPAPIPQERPVLTTAQIRELENEVFQDINQFREGKGLAPLTDSPQIADVARQHSSDMAEGIVSFGHDGFTERVKVLTPGFPKAKHFGENVFDIPSDYSSNLAESITAAWVHSPHHYKNIVGDYTFSGIGAAQSSDGSIYVTQIFVRDQ